MHHEKFMTRRELAETLSEQLDCVFDEATVYVDLTAQDVLVLIPPIYSGISNAKYNGHEVIRMEKVDSRSAFRVMENFARSRPDEQAKLLFRALSRQHPFATFRYAVEDAGIRDDWFAFKNEADIDLAESMLEDSGIDVVDGKIVCNDKSAISIYEAEEFDSEDGDEE